MCKIKLFGACVVLLFALLFGVCYHRYAVVEPKVFRAWVKMTGNPSGLTLDEWRVLYRNTGAMPPFIDTPQ